MKVYLHSIEAAKKNFKTIPNLTNPPDWFSRVSLNKYQDLTKYCNSYNEIEKFIANELRRNSKNSHSLSGHEEIERIGSLTDHNGVLENFWANLYYEYMPK